MKQFLPVLIILTAVVSIFPVRSSAAEKQTQTAQEHSQVLLVCDEGNGRSRLEELTRCCGKSVDSISEADYQTDLLWGYSFLVTTVNGPYRDAAAEGIPTVCIGEKAGPVDGVDTVYLKNVQMQLRLAGHLQDCFIPSALVAYDASGSSETYGSLEMTNGLSFPFAVIGPNAAFVPWYEEDGLSVVMLGGLIKQYLDGTTDFKGKMYVMVDEVYAFSDLDMLRQTADVLHDGGIPFIVRIMPVYDNLDYPAFQRFTQALLYVQSKGGSIVLHDPIVRKYESESELLETKMERAETAFSDAGITLLDMNLPPLGITIEDIHSIGRTQLNFGEFPVDTMIVYRLFETSSELEQSAGALNAAWLSLSSYKVNFSIDDSDYTEKAVEASYIFRKAEQTSLKSFFTGANRVLLMIVSVCVCVFAILLVVGRKINRSKFYKYGGKQL